MMIISITIIMIPNSFVRENGDRVSRNRVGKNRPARPSGATHALAPTHPRNPCTRTSSGTPYPRSYAALRVERSIGCSSFG